MSKERRFVYQQIEDGLEEYHSGAEYLKSLSESIRSIVYETGDPEDFYADTNYEKRNIVEEKITEAVELVWQAFQRRNFQEVIEIGRTLLEVCGIKGARTASSMSPNYVVALAESINWAAKTISYEFYKIKPFFVVSASQIEGVHFGIGDDDAYYLGSEGVGVASFHDPQDEIGYLFGYLNINVPQWQYGWSGVDRQPSSFAILEDLSSNKGLADEYAEATSPEDFREIRRRYLKGNFRNRLATIGEIIESASGNEPV